METLRYLNKQVNQNERQNFSNWWKEQINIHGQQVKYYTNTTQVSASHALYGEQPGAAFGDGQDMILYLDLNNDSVLLSKFGLVAEGEVSGAIHPTTFTAVYGLSSEPNRGDLIMLEEYGIDRLNYPKRGPTIYQLTDVVDEFKINALGGHYVWFISAKRYDFAWEPNSPGSGVGNTPLNDDEEIDTKADENFDYLAENPCSNNSVYGNY